MPPTHVFKPLIDEDATTDICMAFRTAEADPCVSSFRRIASGD